MAYTPIWVQRKDEILGVAHQVIRERPDLWAEAQRFTESRRFINAVAAACQQRLPDQKVGDVVLRAKDIGCNNKRGHEGTSVDVLAFPNATGVRDASNKFPGLEIVDIIIKSETADADIGWIDVTQATIDGGAAGGWLPPEGTIGTGTTASGISLFWLIRGMREKQHKLLKAFDYCKRRRINFVRGFVILGHDPAEGPDPWSIMGTRLHWTDLGNLIAQATDVAFDQFDLQVYWTLAGRNYQIESEEAQNKLVDIFAAAIKPRAHKVILASMGNEYDVNGIPRHTLRHMARRLRSLMPDGFPISLSSPSEMMGGHASYEVIKEEIFAMHGGDSGANTIDIHPTRPEPIWNAETIREVLEDLGFDLDIMVGEPRGPGASAGGDVIDAGKLAGDALSARRAKAIGYVYHPVFGIFGGECDPHWPVQNRFQSFEEIPNEEAITSAIREALDFGSVGPIKPPAPEFEEPPWPPELDEEASEFADRLTAKYGEPHYEGATFINGRPVDPLGWMRWGSDFRQHRANDVNFEDAWQRINENIDQIWAGHEPTAWPAGRYSVPWPPALDADAAGFAGRLIELYETEAPAHHERGVDGLGWVRWSSDYRLLRARGKSDEEAFETIATEIRGIWGV